MTLRVRLLLLVLFAILPAFLLLIRSGLEQRRLATESAQKDALQMAQIASAAHDAIVEGAQQFLTALAQLPQIQDPESCTILLSRLARQYPNYSSLAVADVNGDVYCSSIPGSGPVNVSDRFYFHSVLTTKRFSAGLYTVDRISQVSVVPFAHPVFNDEGQVTGVVIATLNLEWLINLASQIEIPEDGALLVIDNAGAILARFPDPELYIGQIFFDAEVIQAALQKRGDGFSEVQGLDGIHRLYAFATLHQAMGGSAYVSVGIPTSVAYADVNRSVLINLSGMALVAALALIITLVLSNRFIIDPVQSLLKATRKLDEGDLSARSNLRRETSEIGLLAASFDQMAENLQKRNEELLKNEAALQAYSLQLEQSNRELQDFAYIASHDMQEPLRKIQAFSERLETKHSANLSDEARDYLSRMRSSAARMQTLINDLLTYSRVTTKAQPFHRVDLNKVANEVVSDLSEGIAETGGRVEVNHLGEIEADYSQMRQLLQNLVANALKFHCPDRPPIVRISSSFGNETDMVPEPRFTHLIVEDNGIGFDEKYINRIFQPFQRLHNRSQYEGSGIGLAICRKIVERHGGTITARSEIGKGAKFIITLPTKQAKQERNTP
jgi:signal transduction histidine kinase